MRRESVGLAIKNSYTYLKGDLIIPDTPVGMIIFVHGSGSSKSSHRNQLLSNRLNKNNIATLLFDLLSKEEQDSDLQLVLDTSISNKVALFQVTFGEIDWCNSNEKSSYNITLTSNCRR